MTEDDVKKVILLKASKLGWRLWRNNVGVLKDECFKGETAIAQLRAGLDAQYAELQRRVQADNAAQP